MCEGCPVQLACQKFEEQGRPGYGFEYVQSPNTEGQGSCAYVLAPVMELVPTKTVPGITRGLTSDDKLKFYELAYGHPESRAEISLLPLSEKSPRRTMRSLGKKACCGVIVRDYTNAAKSGNSIREVLMKYHGIEEEGK